jgi:hypothetical protein
VKGGAEATRRTGSTYVFDGLMSSIFLWKGCCCVGVVADTETVDELCIIVSCGSSEGSRGVAHHDEARRSATSADVHQ